MKEKKFLIYKITNIKNNKLYIGYTSSGLNKRWYEHKKSAKNGKGFYLHKAIRKYGIGNFKIEIIDRLSSFRNLLQAEILWISLYDSTNKHAGYNITKGGDGSLGRNVSKETREKIGKSNTGKIRTAENKQNISKSLKISYTQERKDKHSINVRKKSLLKSSSQYLGVGYCKNRVGFPWRARTHYKGKEVHLGRFATEADAARKINEFFKNNNILDCNGTLFQNNIMND